MNWELPDIQAGFRKGRGTRDQIANICWIIEKAREFQKNIYFCFLDYASLCVDHNKWWKILKEMGISDHFSCLLRNLYAGQEATVRTISGTTDWFQIGKGIQQGCISPCLCNLYAVYIMRNIRLGESQARNKIAGRKGQRQLGKKASDKAVPGGRRLGWGAWGVTPSMAWGAKWGRPSF